MGYHPRIESADKASFQTSRSLNSALWFINNKRLEDAILGYVAKYAERYGVKMYAFSLEGNHSQFPALFPNCNRSSFMRDLNSSIARAIPRYTNHPGGRYFARRYSNEFLPGAPDIEEYFFYTVLQPVQDGLVEKISDYPGYNCFSDAVWGRKRKFKVVRWGEFNAARRRDSTVKRDDYTDIVTFQYERIPGYEHLTQKEYAHLMMNKLEARRQALNAERAKKGLGYAGKEKLLKTIPGSLPRSTKTSTITSHRPRVLSICPIRRKDCLDWYFWIYYKFKECSRRYRDGDLTVEFPVGTYPPHRFCPLPLAA